MTQEVFGLRYEFVYRHGHYMVLYKEDGLDSKTLSTLQVRMLEANDVPNLLQLEIQEVDFRISLLYNLSAKRMLSHVLKVEGLSKQHFAKLMYAIVCALGESKNYMLFESGYVLRDNFIFIGSDWSDVFLTYVPLEPTADEESVSKSLESLMKQLSHKLNNEERTVVVSWMESLSRNRSLQGYKENLLALMDEHLPVQEAYQASNHDNEQVPEIRPNTQMPPVKVNGLPKPLWNRNELHQPVILNNSIEELQPKKEASMKERSEGLPVSFTSLSGRSRTIVLAVVILLIAFLWQNYFTYPSTSTLQITSGISILLMNVWFVIRFLGLPRFQRYTKESSGVNLPIFPVVERQLDQKLEAPSPEPTNIQNYYQNLHMHTTLLSQKKPNATVFLGRLMNQPLGARIEWQIEGTTKTFPLNNDHFTMGRGDASLKVDYVLEEAGASRIHAEIIKIEEGYVIKDTGSTNGTYLNGEPLVTYQSYPLKDGDEIRIVRQEIRFRL
ncbi:MULTISPECIES: DUF6382 domain-containing protein [unclassified Paenibacillus]|uniref:DUF6382 domain-containing protein n=1 Tax=unclassified Paenibacillus TaxID=185978 RepID=UPI002788A9E4|nr:MULTISPECIES: DUF6382 domain-containing protein [unclassified Paenibacillus]MDQ0898601.1 pSer/pThr/pTyr-binding forkhead associated (FHA) protein [Paenibacillus sp. V4I7]MDQ0915408.1 pSer/pThr/pTyr-binding forkhead associated (FHA) protein [Paenibacillus sp. V4I5]